ncbi:cation channel sperm-associated protein subunit gamma 1-like [Watersipora subatra]|uniref:cation channel sperm-associated protein subunit gamma 1-like n=1 Tax=Watersipora subatra TaxID=2589382 RepID=UPI00355C5869
MLFGVTQTTGLKRHNHKLEYDIGKLPPYIYLDKTSVTNFAVEVYLLKDKSVGKDVDSELETLSGIQLSLELSVLGLITLQTTRSQDFYRDVVKFFVKMKLNRTALPGQGLPGRDLLPVSLTMKVSIDTHCSIPQEISAGFTVGSAQTMRILLGCPPQLTPTFDLRGTIEELEHHTNHLHCLNRDEHENCFYFQHTFYPHFDIFDSTMGSGKSFRGKYTLKVVGGGTRYSKIRRFTEEEIIKANLINQTYVADA